MKRIVNFVLVLAFMIAFLSCGQTEPTLDCSSPTSFAESTTEMLKYVSENASPEEQQAFSMGIFKITMEFNNSGEDAEVLSRYDGWTIQQVMDHGK
jgi:hypothetical protein